MDTESTSTTQDRQITIEVPEDRVAEFYAFYARFLSGRTRGRRGPGRGHRHGGGCRGRHAEQSSESTPAEVQSA